MSVKVILELLSSSEEELITFLKNDDLEVRRIGLYELLKKFSNFILVVANSKATLTRDELDDFVSDLYVSLIEGGKLRDIENFTSFLAKCVKNKMIDRLRVSERYREHNFNVDIMQNEDINKLPNDEIENFFDELEILLKTKLEREILNLYKEGKTKTQVSELLDIPPQKVKRIWDDIKIQLLSSFK